MAGVPVNRGCYECGSMSHWVRDCPHRARQFRPPATEANTVPTGAPLLTLLAPSSFSAPPNPSSIPSNSHEAGPSNYGAGYQQPTRSGGWWRANQERLDMCYSKYLEDQQKEVKRKEEEEKARVRKEEDRKLEWKKERELFEQEMGNQLEKRMQKLCLVKEGGKEAVGASSMVNEVATLKAENEMRRMELGGGQEIMGMKKEIEALRGKNERAMDEAVLWKSEALRPGNKRESIAINTPDCSLRGTPKPRWTDNIREGDKWKEEYRKLQGLHKVTNTEAEVLKMKRDEAEVKRMEAEKQVKSLQDKLSRLTAKEKGDKPVSGGTNLKERLEEVALRSTRKGKKATPGRVARKGDGYKENDANDRFAFIEDQRKQLRMMRKCGLESLCKDAGIKLGKVDQMVSESADFRDDKAFGKSKGKEKAEGSPSQDDCSVYEGMDVGIPHVRRKDLSGCFQAETGRFSDKVCKEEDLRTWCALVDGLVRVPIDHNPGDTLVCCPLLYREGMRKLFLGNDEFVECEEGEANILRKTKSRYNDAKLGGLAKWDARGSVGKAYAIPKHKDAMKWRPVCPSQTECSVRVCWKVSQETTVMATSNGFVRSCYNFGQAGHIQCFCPHPPRQAPVSNPNSAIVPVQTQPLLTLPSTSNNTYFNSQLNRGGWTGPSNTKRIKTLEETVTKIKIRHDAEEEHEKKKSEDEEKERRDKEDELRRQKDKQDRDEHYKQIGDLISSRLGGAEEIMNLKKKEVCDIKTLRVEVDNLKKMRNLPVATVNEVESSVRLQREYDEAKHKAQEASKRRIAALEEQVQSLKRISEEAMNKAEG
ncbi:hypothetical protein CBR_g22962 [Chara braunii]|uniref:CCHC-type domain-containing protein n=1 Tax=Chara braunii TaxID=69332 RepID=A0A388L372_CHABU|nr:hypothetical protein CBR_g22962 [Chara braunii]|eukprot:GBG76746.1 hypothetical protein CBR_g22962 [Chara braunii]